MVIIVGDCRILYFQPLNRFFERLDVLSAPVQIKEVPFSSTLGNSDHFHNCDIQRRKNPNRAVVNKLLLWNEKGVSDKANLRLKQLAVNRILSVERSFPVAIS